MTTASAGEASRAATSSRVALEGLVELEAIRAAAARLRGVARRTPLHPSGLSAPDDPGSPVWLKCENLQHVSAFKVRGAYNFVSLLPESVRAEGLVTYSSGNHAQGVAFAARAFGVPATIVMPVDVPRVKLEATRALGARVELEGTTSSERQRRAEEILAEEGGAMVPPFDHPHIIAGQGTVGLEIVEQLREAAERGVMGGAQEKAGGSERTDGGRAAEADEPRRPGLVLVPIGGGGLISGVAAAVRTLAPEARVIGVEPEGAASMRASLEAGGPTTLESVETVADGLKPVRPGDLTFRHCRALVERIVTVTDEEIRQGFGWLFRRRLVVEPSGAATAAALLAGKVEPVEDGATVVVVSGGNVEPDLVARWLA